jgi:hypothetical protein
MDKVKISGYTEKISYNGNIEYRNYSPDLVGLQLASNGGTPLFTMGNFSINTNVDPKLSKTYITKQFSDFVTLDDLKLTIPETQTLLDNNTAVFLNLDKTRLSYYSTFGSLTEFIRVSLENIITYWPASLYLTPIVTDKFGNEHVDYTFYDYNYDFLTDTSTFKLPTNQIVNQYNINYLTNGVIDNTFNESNPLRNMVMEFDSYCIHVNNLEFNVLEFTGSTDTVNEYLYFKTKGNPFSGLPSTTQYHIKPKNIIVDKFFNGLDEFEYHLLNRLTYPKYTAVFSFPLRTDTGVLLFTQRTLTWPTTDGYNLDYDTEAYVTYASQLLEISNDSDLINSNLMTRFLVTESITGFDTLPYYLSDEQQDTSGGKVNKLLNIYGRSFDDFNKYIEGISVANSVSYDKIDNTPDIYLKNIARVLGWELIESVVSNDLLTDYIQSSQSTYSGQSVGLTPAEADIELWRRIILNTPWIWKSKGTRKTIEFLLRFIGTPNGLITFNEYVYKADKPIDVEMFVKILELNGYEPDTSLYPIDSEGYPRFFDENDDMYFQGNGLWYRETSGSNSILDITSGNNPHIGPYDRGYKYFNQLRTLIPNFSAVTITSETTTTTSQDLFTNYNTGEITDYVGETYVDVTLINGQTLPNCFIYETQIVNDPKPQSVETACGCPTDVNDDSLSICVEKKVIKNEVDCGIRPILFSDGYYVFQVYSNDSNGDNTNNTIETPLINRECCTGISTGNLGVPMYNDIYVSDTLLIEDPLIKSGYMCCSKLNGKCACKVSSDWIIAPAAYYINGQPYLKFITLNGLGSEVIVGADTSLCPTQWTTPVSDVSDPFHTNLVGFGCKLTPEGLLNLNILYEAYIKKAESEKDCGYVYPTIPTPNNGGGTNPPQLVCNDPNLISVVDNKDNTLTFTFSMINTPCSDFTIEYQYSLFGLIYETFATTLSQPNSNSNIYTETVQGNNFSTNVSFRVKITYITGNNCAGPFLDCNVVSNIISVNFNEGITIPEGDTVFVTPNPFSTFQQACVDFNLNYASNFQIGSSIISPTLQIGANLWRTPLFGNPYIETNAGWYVSGSFGLGSSFRIDNTGKVVEISPGVANCIGVFIP